MNRNQKMKKQKVTIPVFDYDRTLCSDTVIPSKNSFESLVKSIREKLGLPLIIITAGTVNSTSRGGRDDGVDRPLEFCKDCNLRVLMNEFNINADVCVYGRYICDPQNKDKDKELNSNNYIRGSTTTYRPITKIGNDTYHILSSTGEKKLSVLYHILLSHGLDSEILLIDDMYYHDMSGLEGMILDPFECTDSSYYLIKPLLDTGRTSRNVDSRLFKLAKSIHDGNFKEVLEGMCHSVWRRF